MAKVRALAQSEDWWVLAGNVPPGIPPGFYAELIQQIQAAGGKVILDTSDEPLRLGCAARPYLVKPNAYEASQLTGLPVDSLDEAVIAARALKGVEYVVISMGKAGALLVHERQGWFASTPPVYVTPNGRLLSDATTYYSLALEFDLLPTPEQRCHAGKRLVELVRENGYHISTGFVGTPLICDALSTLWYGRVFLGTRR